MPSVNNKAATGGKESKNDKAGFAKAMAAIKGGDAWSSARTRPPVVQGELLRGKFPAKVTGVGYNSKEIEIQDEKNPRVKRKIPCPNIRINFTVTDGEKKGANVAKWFTLKPASVPYAEIDWEQLSATLQLLGYDISEAAENDIPGILDSLLAEKPECEINCSVRGGKNGGKEFQQVNVMGELAAAPDGGGDNGGDATATEAGDPDDGNDWTALAEAADDEENPDAEDAQKQLAEAAEAVGIDPNGLGTWSDVAEAINEATAEEPEPEPEPAKPASKPVKKKPAAKPAPAPRKKVPAKPAGRRK